MKANQRQLCPRCTTWIEQGAEIKPHFKMAGLKPDGKPLFIRGQGYVHTKCPPKAKRKVDRLTGEIL